MQHSILDGMAIFITKATKNQKFHLQYKYAKNDRLTSACTTTPQEKIQMLLNDLIKQDDSKEIVENPSYIQFSNKTVRFGDRKSVV